MKAHLRRLYPGAKTAAMDVAVYGAASYGFGYLQNRYRDQASVMGVPADAVAGVALTVASIVGGVYGGSKVRSVLPYAQMVGLAGIGSFLHTLGAGKGAQASGVKRLLVDAKDVAKVKTMLPNTTVLGQIPKAPHGDFLSSSDLAALARG